VAAGHVDGAALETHKRHEANGTGTGHAGIRAKVMCAKTEIQCGSRGHGETSGTVASGTEVERPRLHVYAAGVHVRHIDFEIPGRPRPPKSSVVVECPRAT